MEGKAVSNKDLAYDSNEEQTTSQVHSPYKPNGVAGFKFEVDDFGVYRCFKSEIEIADPDIPVIKEQVLDLLATGFGESTEETQSIIIEDVNLTTSAKFGEISDLTISNPEDLCTGPSGAALHTFEVDDFDDYRCTKSELEIQDHALPIIDDEDVDLLFTGNIENPSTSTQESTHRLSQLAPSEEHRESCPEKSKRIFQCGLCLKTFTRSGNLKRHKMAHTGEKPFGCDVCLKTFSRSYNLKEHQRIHTKESPFKCELCSKTFTRSGTLKIHKTTHTGSGGQRLYQCDVCLKVFLRFYLKRHKMTHKREWP